MKNIFALVLFIITIKATAQNGILWTTTYGGLNYDQHFTICKTNDGGTLAAGYTNSSDTYITGNHGFTDILLIKYSAAGDFEWQKCYGGQINEAALDIIAMADGSFCMVGRNQSFDGDCTAMYGETDLWVVKVDEQGNLLWQKSYGGSLGDFGSSIVAAEGNNLIIAGGAFSSNAPLTDQNGQGDMWLMKIDELGNIVWSNCFGSSTYDSGTLIKATIDGNFIFIGGFNTGNNEITVTSHGAADAIVVKMAPDGTIIWQYAFGGSQNDMVEEIIELPDGSFVIAGDSRSSNGDLTSTNNGLTDFWVFRISAAGSLMWSKNFGSNNSDYVRGLTQLNDGNIAFVGETQGTVNGIPLFGTSDVYLGLLDLNGNIIHEDIIGGTNFDYVADLTLDLDGNLLLGGYSWSNDNDILGNNGYTDSYLMKYQIQQELCNGIDDDNDSEIDEYPDWDGDGLNACNGDCNEYNSLINAFAQETCDFVDENCNGLIDDGLPMLPYYLDNDNDGYGAGDALEFCANPGIGFVISNIDCDDTNASVNPGIPEIIGNGIDDDCNSDTDDVSVLENDIVNSVFPNPVESGYLNIYLNQIPENKKLDFFDFTGRVILSQPIYALFTRLDVNSLASGTYLLKLNENCIRVQVYNE
jgi:Secretion system C-terminal sorting domain/Putative metal-binding motif